MLETVLIFGAIGGGAAVVVLHTFSESKHNCGAMLSFYANLLADVRKSKAEQAETEIHATTPAP